MLWFFWCGACTNRFAAADRVEAGGFARVADIAVPVVALGLLAVCHLIVCLLQNLRSAARGILWLAPFCAWEQWPAIDRNDGDVGHLAQHE